MNLFQIVLDVLIALIVILWLSNLPAKIAKLKNKKEESLVRDKMLSEDEKQKIRDEDYVNLFTKLRNENEIYITSHGTVLNSKPHTFKDFINNQKLPSKLELVWEILADNNVQVKDIIQKIEDGAPYPPDTMVHRELDALKVTQKQIKMINTIHFDDGNLLLIDNDYPLYIKFKRPNSYTGVLYVSYQAGYEYDDKNLDRGAPTKPTKY